MREDKALDPFVVFVTKCWAMEKCVRHINWQKKIHGLGAMHAIKREGNGMH